MRINPTEDYYSDENMDDVTVKLNIYNGAAPSTSSSTDGMTTKLQEIISSTIKLEPRFILKQHWFYSLTWFFMVLMCLFLILQLVLVLKGYLRRASMSSELSGKPRKFGWMISAAIISQAAVSIITLAALLSSFYFHKNLLYYYPIFYMIQAYCAILFIMGISSILMSAKGWRRAFRIDGIPAALLISSGELVLCVVLDIMIALNGSLGTAMVLALFTEYVFRQSFIVAMCFYVEKSRLKAEKGIIPESVEFELEKRDFKTELLEP